MTRPLVLAAVSLWAVLADAREPQLCSKASRRLQQACEAEVDDGFWVAAANCTNVPGAAARRACEGEARRAQREERAGCGEQRDARQSLCDALGQAAYDPPVDAARFLDPAAAAARPHPLFPLVPGTIWMYRGGRETVTVTVTGQTKQILGVACTLVRDVGEQDGVVIEDTDDYFAQDVDGNMWYFGELSRSFENGELTDLEGSWRAGQGGAKPGVIMKATPRVGDVYRQEFAAGDAEDAAEVLSVTATATVPAASCSATCLETRDFTPIEPDAEEHKFYVPGIGLILEVDMETGERVELVGFTPG